MEANEFRHTILSIKDIDIYFRGGHGMFTMQSQETMRHMSYKISTPKEIIADKDRPLWISFLSGADNEFHFIGTVWESKMVFNISTKSKITADAPCVKGIVWLLDKIKYQKELPETMAFWHEGICCRCGRTLTNPESIENGIGPVCNSY